MNHPVVTLLLPAYSLNLCERPDSFDFHNDAQRQPWQASLATIAGVDTFNGRQLPGARLALFEEQVHRRELQAGQSLVRADPISLKADRDNATLVPAQFLDIQEDEAVELVAALNAFTAEDNLDFFKDENGVWYMTGMAAHSLDTYPPSFLANRHASMFLPDGQEAAQWRRLLTEIQMLLHTHPVNQRRELRGQMPINSVWFWGGADLPQKRSDQKDVQFYADDNQARIWADVLGVPTFPLEQFTDDLGNIDNIARSVVLDLGLLAAWIEQDADILKKELERVNQQWLEPLAEHVSQQRIKRVDIQTEDSLRGFCSSETLDVAASGPVSWQKRLSTFFTRSSS